MTPKEILDILNSFYTFLLLAGIIVMLWILISIKEKRAKPSKR